MQWCIAVAMLGWVAVPGRVEARPRPTMDRAVAAARLGAAPIRVIIRTEAAAAPDVGAALVRRGRRPHARLHASAALGVTLAPADIEAVLALPGVTGLSLDAAIHPTGANAKKTLTTTTDTTSGKSKKSTDTSAGSKTASPTESVTNGSVSSGSTTTSLTPTDLLLGTLGVRGGSASGKGIGVAVVDSGIDGRRAELAGRITAFYDFTAGGVSAPPTDEYGHGTHVSALIGASSTSLRGVAPDVRFIGVKVLDAQGQGTTSQLIAAIDFVREHRRALGVDVINLSLGHPVFEPAATDPLVQAVERAVAAGLVVVTSAGNIGQHPETGAIGYAGITSPGNAPSAITVGSFDMHGTIDRRDDTVSDFSSRGPTWYDGLVKPDVVAPGERLQSLNSDGSTLSATNPLSLNGSAVTLSGTSMAAATTTGVVALMLDTSRREFGGAARLTPNAVKAILQYTSLSLQRPDPAVEYDLLTEGAGGLNGSGAVALAGAIDPTAAAGTWWLATPVQEVSTFDGATLPWTRRLVWGATLVSGQGVYTNAPSWQTSTVWGDSFIWGDSFVWGDSLVWGEIFVWGENVVTATSATWTTSVVWGDGLVAVNGQSFVWGDSLIWGESLIWGDALVWGAVHPQ